MKLQSCTKLEDGRSVPPEETVARLENLLGDRFEYRLLEEKVADSLYWTALFLEDDPDFRSMGKGVTALQSRAGAFAEAAGEMTERIAELGPSPLRAETTGKGSRIEQKERALGTKRSGS